MKKKKPLIDTKRGLEYYSLLRYYRDVKTSTGNRAFKRFIKRAYNRHVRRELKRRLTLEGDTHAEKESGI